MRQEQESATNLSLAACISQNKPPCWEGGGGRGGGRMSLWKREQGGREERGRLAVLAESDENSSYTQGFAVNGAMEQGCPPAGVKGEHAERCN